MDLKELDGEKVGDRIEAVVIKAAPDVRLSRKLAIGHRTKAELRAAAEAKIPVAGKVSSRNKGGFDVLIGGRTGTARSARLAVQLGRQTKPRSRPSSARRSTSASSSTPRTAARRRLARRAPQGGPGRAAGRDTREDHSSAPSSPARPLPHGLRAFVDLGGVDGLVHVTEISRRRVAHPKDVLTVGQEVTVKVTKLAGEGKRISLSMEELRPTRGDARRTASLPAPRSRVPSPPRGFGLFVEVEPGVDGLVHVSALPPASRSRFRPSRTGRPFRAGSRKSIRSTAGFALAARSRDGGPMGGHPRAPPRAASLRARSRASRRSASSSASSPASRA